MKQTQYFITISILTSLLTVVDSTLFFLNDTLVKDVNTPSIRATQHFNISGKVVFANPDDWCGSIENSKVELEGSILWINPTLKPFTCSLAKRIQKAEEHKVKGVIFASAEFARGSGMLAYFLQYQLQHVYKSSIPAVEIPFQDNQDIISLLKQEASIVSVELTDGKNLMTETRDVWIAFSLIAGLFSLSCVIVATYKLSLFVRATGFQLNVPQGCLMLNVFSCLFRLIQCIDPPYTRGIFPQQFAAVLELMNYPLALCSALLIAFYWEEAMRAAQVHSIPNLQRMKKPFLVSACILLSLAMLSVVLRSLNSFQDIIALINLMLVLIFSVPITFFYSWEAAKILKILFASRRVDFGKPQTALYKMTLLLIGCAITLFAHNIEYVAMLLYPFSINRWIAMRFLFHTNIGCVCLFQALAFQNPLECQWPVSQPTQSITSGTSSNRKNTETVELLTVNVTHNPTFSTTTSSRDEQPDIELDE